MTVFETVSIIGLFIGPLAAVALTLWAQRSSQLHDRRLDVARKLIETHHDAGERDFSSAIRLVPVEFRHDPTVIQAWRSLMENVTNQPTPMNEVAHNIQFLDRKFSLIFEICRSTRIGLTESDIRNSVYEARAFAEDKKLTRDARRALVRIADTMSNNPLAPTVDQDQ